MCKLIFRRIAIVCRQISSVASGEDQRAYGLVGDGGEQVTVADDSRTEELLTFKKYEGPQIHIKQCLSKYHWSRPIA